MKRKVMSIGRRAQHVHTAAALLALAALPAALAGQSGAAAVTHPHTPVPQLLPVESELRMALEAAPPHLRERAGVYILRHHGFVQHRVSTNGFTCIINRDHPRALKPTCWDAEGTRTIVPVVLHTGELLMRGVSVDSIQRDIAHGFATGRFVPPARPGVAYMLSPDIRNVDFVTGEERSFPPHVMFYAPNLTNADIGAADNVAEGMPFIDYHGPHGYMIVMPRRPERKQP